LWLNGNKLTTVPADIFAALTTTKFWRLLNSGCMPISRSKTLKQ
jgi:hypothetical protein